MCVRPSTTKPSCPRRSERRPDGGAAAVHGAADRLERQREFGAGGIVPPEDAALLAEAGIAAVYTPKDYDLTAIMAGIVDRSHKEAA